MNALPSSETTLKNLRQYLVSRDWSVIEHPNTRLEIFETKPGETGEFASVVLPRSIDFRDALTLMNEATQLVAQFEGTSITTVVDQILRWDRDILRSRFFKIHGHEDTLPLGVAANAVTRIKEFLGYAAYTQSNPKPFFDKVGSISGAFTDHCLFGHTFRGSFGLTVECPLQIIPELGIEGVAPAVPIERQIVERIANGLMTLTESVSKDSIDPLIAGYLTGFNANMFRKIAEVYEHADGRRIEYDISWSPQMKSKYALVWKPTTFDSRAYEFVQSAATELEKAEEFPDSKVEGRIIVLRSEMPPGLDEQEKFEHIITMSWERERGQTVKIRIPLSSQQYIEACDAHKDGRPIRIFGVPEKAGKFWTLTKPHDFMVLR